jgi:hypothetical protein
MNKQIFWGYIDDQGKIEVKKYFDDRTIENYERLPFVKGVFDPFYANDIWDARKMITERYKMEMN